MLRRRFQRGLQTLSIVCGVFVAISSWSAADAADFQIVPGSDADSADGSVDAPYPTVNAAIDGARVAGGDRLILAGTSHGRIRVHNRRFDPPLQIQAMPGAHVEYIDIRNSAGLYFDGLSVWPLGAPHDVPALVYADDRSADVTFANFDVRGAESATAYREWTREDWKAHLVNGARLNGPRQSLINSRLTGLNFAIQASGASARVIGNRIHGFAGDAMRGIGDDGVFRGNQVFDCIELDNGNHDDGFQSWATKHEDGRRVSGLVIDSNLIVEWSGPQDHPLRCTMQGIGLFDGPYYDIEIRNNVILVGAYHGIAIYGGVGSRIVNNTVLPITGAPGNRAWIGMFPLKKNLSGPPPSDNIVANNVSGHYVSKAGAGVVLSMQRSNALVAYPMSRFPTLFDAPLLEALRPTQQNGFLDTALPEYAPDTDFLGQSRPLGDGPDLGAIEAGP